MSKNKQNILDECLDRINKGADVEQCLKDYPHMQELRPALMAAFLARKASATVQPRPEFKETAKVSFLTHVRNREREHERHKTRQSFFGWQPRWIMAAIAALLVISLGSGVVTASSNSMPDNILYPVKIAVENVRLNLTGSGIKRAELEVQFVDRRITEIAKMAEEGKEQKADKIAERLTQHLTEVQKISTTQNIENIEDENKIIALRNTLSGYVTDHTLVLEDALQKSPSATQETINRVLSAAQEHYTDTIKNINSTINIKKWQSNKYPDKEEIFDGVIRRTADNNWVVGDKVINIDSRTNVQGDPVVGSRVSANVIVQPDGALQGEKVIVHQNTTQVDINNNDSGSKSSVSKISTEDVNKSKSQNDIPHERTVKGIIGRMTGTEWIVGSKSVVVYSGTVIEGKAAVGLLAEATVLVQQDGTMLARKITIQNISDVQTEKNNKTTPTPAPGTADERAEKNSKMALTPTAKSEKYSR